jgi:molybdopterin-guanine dinucleotide biosynthesis protein A
MAIWRADASATCERALARGARRVREVLEEIGGIEIPVTELGLVEPERSLLNVNDRETLALALRLDSGAIGPAP